MEEGLKLVERGILAGVQQGGLVVEDPEDRPLGNPGRSGELFGGDIETLLQHKGDGGLDERGASVGRRQGGRPAWPGLGGHHPGTLNE